MHLLRSRRAQLGMGALVALVIVATATFAVVNAAPEPTPIPSPIAFADPIADHRRRRPAPRRRRRRPRHRRRRRRPAARWTAGPLDDRTLADRVPIIVQIENNPIARPPSGLNLADLVIEAPVEGDTTRFMAVFMCRPQVDAMVGPVRSVRYFNADLFQQLRGLTLHFGGAAKVIANLDANGVPRVNGLTTGWYFFQRAGVWGAPHNVFLDIDAARPEMEEGGLQAVADIERAGRRRSGSTPTLACPAGGASTASA